MNIGAIGQRCDVCGYVATKGREAHYCASPVTGRAAPVHDADRLWGKVTPPKGVRKGVTVAKAKASKASEMTALTLVAYKGEVGYVADGKFVPFSPPSLPQGKASLPDATPAYDLRGLGVSDAKLVCKLARLLGVEVSGEPAKWPEYDASKAAHWKGAQYAVNVRHGEVGLIQVRAQYTEPRTG